MLKEKMLLLNRLHVVSDVFLTIAAFFMAWVLNAIIKNDPFAAGFIFSDPNLIAIGVIWAFLILNQKSPYVYRTKSNIDLVRPVMMLVMKGGCGFLIWLFISKSPMHSRLFLILFLASDFLLLLLLRIGIVNFLQSIRSRGRNCQQILVVGTGSLAKKVIDDIKENPKWGIRVIGILDVIEPEKLWRYRDVPLIGGLDNLADIVKCSQVDYVVYATNRKFLDKLDESIQLCERMG